MKKTEREHPMGVMNHSLVVNKDLIPGLVGAYRELLRTTGISGRDRRQAVTRVETILYDGNPQVTVGGFDRLRRIVVSETIK